MRLTYTTVFGNCFVYHGFHAGFIGGIELSRMNVDIWIQLVHLTFVDRQVVVLKVANENSSGFIVSKLVSGCSANA